MKRRQFLKLPLGLAALTSAAQAAETVATPAPRSPRGYRVPAHQSRDDSPLSIMGGTFALKISARDTGGDLCVYDTVRSTKGGPPLHRHYFQDEWFYILRGEFIARVGEDLLTLRPGDSVFAPRKIPHTFAMTSAGEGQMLVLFQPAGSMEDFFHQMSKLGQDVTAADKLATSIWERHGMELLGPPLKLEK